ncbi:hypothetical protein E8E14_003526 [Neopestalotiopsis sp. 37M]|nr:hypothetical protein E8E14_003526 [Neopestalotiopsis sp. 37M]
MSSLGEKIKSVFTTEHSPEAEKGLVDHRTPGSFPEDDSTVPRSQQHIAGTSSAQEKEYDGHNKLHKRDDPRGYTVPVGQESSFVGGRSHDYADSGAREQQYTYDNNKNLPASSTTDPSTHDNSRLATDQQNRPDTSAVPGTGIAAAGAGGLAARELGEDRSGQKPHSQVMPGSSEGHGSGYNTNTSRDVSSGLAGTEAGDHSRHHNQLGAAGISSFPASSTQASTVPGQESHRDMTNSQETSGTQKDEPYWGDLPQGSGVYNTVIGHGSGEDTSVQHRTKPRDSAEENSPRHSITGASQDLSYGSGVYNTVTGHGSNDEHDATHHNKQGQREFPLNDNHHGTSNDRHIGEAGAAVGAGAAAYGAAQHHKHAKEADRQAPLSSGSNVTSTGVNYPSEQARHTTATNTGALGAAGVPHRPKDQSEQVVGGSSARDLDDRHAKDTTDSTGHKHKITGFLHRRHDQEGGNAAHQQWSQTPADQTSSSLAAGSTRGPEHNRTLDDESSHRDRNAALAGAGAAAAAGYGLSRKDKHHDATEPAGQYQREQTSAINNPQTTLPRETAHQPTGYASNTAPLQQSGNTSNVASGDDRHTARNLAGVGAAAGAGYGASTMAQHEKQPMEARESTTLGSGSMRSPGNTASQSGTYAPTAAATGTGRDSYDHLPSGTASGVARDTTLGQGQSNLADTTGRHSGAAQHIPGNQGGSEGPYNVLASGTPSGVHVEPKHSTHTNTMGTASRQPVSTNMNTMGTPSRQPGSNVSEDCPKCGATNDLSHYFEK